MTVAIHWVCVLLTGNASFRDCGHSRSRHEILVALAAAMAAGAKEAGGFLRCGSLDSSNRIQSGSGIRGDLLPNSKKTPDDLKNNKYKVAVWNQQPSDRQRPIKGASVEASGMMTPLRLPCSRCSMTSWQHPTAAFRWFENLCQQLSDYFILFCSQCESVNLKKSSNSYMIPLVDVGTSRHSCYLQ